MTNTSINKPKYVFIGKRNKVMKNPNEWIKDLDPRYFNLASQSAILREDMDIRKETRWCLSYSQVLSLNL